MYFVLGLQVCSYIIQYIILLIYPKSSATWKIALSLSCKLAYYVVGLLGLTQQARWDRTGENIPECIPPHADALSNHIFPNGTFEKTKQQKEC